MAVIPIYPRESRMPERIMNASQMLMQYGMAKADMGWREKLLKKEEKERDDREMKEAAVATMNILGKLPPETQMSVMERWQSNPTIRQNKYMMDFYKIYKDVLGGAQDLLKTGTDIQGVSGGGGTQDPTAGMNRRPGTLSQAFGYGAAQEMSPEDKAMLDFNMDLLRQKFGLKETHETPQEKRERDLAAKLEEERKKKAEKLAGYKPGERKLKWETDENTGETIAIDTETLQEVLRSKTGMSKEEKLQWGEDYAMGQARGAAAGQKEIVGEKPASMKSFEDIEKKYIDDLDENMKKFGKPLKENGVVIGFIPDAVKTPTEAWNSFFNVGAPALLTEFEKAYKRTYPKKGEEGAAEEVRARLQSVIGRIASRYGEPPLPKQPSAGNMAFVEKGQMSEEEAVRKTIRAHFAGMSDATLYWNALVWGTLGETEIVDIINSILGAR